MKNAKKEAIPAKRELKQIYKQALQVRQTLIDNGKTALPEYGFLNHYIDLYNSGVTAGVRQHLSRAIQDILTHESVQHLFPET